MKTKTENRNAYTIIIGLLSSFEIEFFINCSIYILNISTKKFFTTFGLIQIVNQTV